MSEYIFDIVIVGGGAAGFVAAKFALGVGKKVAIVEKERLGGECTWTGCVPSKALIRLARSGMDSNIMDEVRAVRQKIYDTHTPEMFEKMGIKVFVGVAKFINNKELVVGETKIKAKKFIISTGSSPFVPPIDGLSETPYLTNQNFFDLKNLPKSLLILGGGPIGTELSSALVKLGVAVSVVEMQKHILSREDEELALMLQEKLIKDGVKIYTQTKAIRVEKKDAQIVLYCQDENEKEIILSAETLLVATGRKPNLDGLALESAGVEYDRRSIKTNKKLQTSQKNIYACGDVVGPYQFSHMAEYQAIIAARNSLFPWYKKVNYENKTWVTFCDPELASVGLNEKLAREIFGDRVRVYKIDYSSIDRAIVDNKTFGRAKFICDKKGNLLGAQILGPRAGEIIQEVQFGKTMGINFAKFDNVIHAYPTYCDLVKKAARACRIDLIKNNFFVKLLRKATGK
jgi:pyruvate/2-oxoglutarate dehydrogenase complex dihydrolipoamide dehydrogenase (E3) component